MIGGESADGGRKPEFITREQIASEQAAWEQRMQDPESVWIEPIKSEIFPRRFRVHGLSLENFGGLVGPERHYEYMRRIGAVEIEQAPRLERAKAAAGRMIGFIQNGFRASGEEQL